MKRSSLNQRAVRRTQILDAAERLVYAKGYAQMTVQDLLDVLQLSKGGFFHHFGSKAELLEALIERWLDDAERLMTPIVDDSELPALDKLQQCLTAISRWKTAQKRVVLALMRSWYSDSNAIARQKLEAVRVQRFAHLFTRIIAQGIQEGTFSTAYPERLGQVVLFLFQSLGDALAGLLLSDGLAQTTLSDSDRLHDAEQTVAVYTEALERVLGAPSGSLQLVDSDTLKEWFVSSRETESAAGSPVHHTENRGVPA